MRRIGDRAAMVVKVERRGADARGRVVLRRAGTAASRRVEDMIAVDGCDSAQNLVYSK